MVIPGGTRWLSTTARARKGAMLKASIHSRYLQYPITGIGFMIQTIGPPRDKVSIAGFAVGGVGIPISGAASEVKRFFRETVGRNFSHFADAAGKYQSADDMPPCFRQKRIHA